MLKENRWLLQAAVDSVILQSTNILEKILKK